MNYTWFKLHHEMPDDIKLRRFTPQEKWAWVVLLCLASKSSTRGVIDAEDEDIAEYCEFNCTQDWQYFRDKLIKKGMIDFTGDGHLKVENWESRQYEKPSDRPEAVKARVRKHREKKKKQQETPSNALQTPSNASETPQIREEEIRSDQKRSDPDQTIGSHSSRSDRGEEMRKSVAQPAQDPFLAASQHKYPWVSSRQGRVCQYDDRMKTIVKRHLDKTQFKNSDFQAEATDINGFLSKAEFDPAREQQCWEFWAIAQDEQPAVPVKTARQLLMEQGRL